MELWKNKDNKTQKHKDALKMENVLIEEFLILVQTHQTWITKQRNKTLLFNFLFKNT